MLVGEGTADYPLSAPRPLWSEQSPEDWWQGAAASIRQALAAAGITGDQVACVGLSGQMHGLVLLDAAGEVLRPAILWNDQRTAEQCAWITERVGGLSRLLELTGNPALPGFTAPKLVWVRENEPEVYAQIAHILLPKDYVRYRLTGEFAIDMADASGTLLLDVARRRWSQEMQTALDIPTGWLPRLLESPQVSGVISPQAAALCGLKAGTPVVAGAGDQAAGAVGVGAVSPGTISLVLGTSGVVFAPSSEPFIEAQGRLHAFCHAVPGTWHLMGVMLSAAGSLRWYRDTLAPGSSYDDLLRPAEEVPPGCEGLLFLPYLTGERTPHPDPLARGAFVGLTLRHGMPHMTRAVLEGVAFGLRDSFSLLQATGLGAVQQVRVSGGGGRSRLWRQILADVLGVELVTVNTVDAAAYGAALLAGVGAGIWESVPAACQATVRTGEAVQPDPERVQRYSQLYPLYDELYPSLQDLFRADM